jgi:hypothetical protein
MVKGGKQVARFKLIVFSSPTAGREEDYNKWYTGTHLKDVVESPGFVSAQRFRLQKVAGGQFRHKYLAIYDVDADDPDKVMAELGSRAGTSAMVISDALDSTTLDVAMFEEFTPRVGAAVAT